MSNTKTSSNLHYQIVVQGHLSSLWNDRMGDMKFEFSAPQEMPEKTVLRGTVIDQTELYGILTSLYELHFPLLSVECLGVIPTDQG